MKTLKKTLTTLTNAELYVCERCRNYIFVDSCGYIGCTCIDENENNDFDNVFYVEPSEHKFDDFAQLVTMRRHAYYYGHKKALIWYGTTKYYSVSTDPTLHDCELFKL